MVMSYLLQKLRDRGGHDRFPTKSEEKWWSRPISHRIRGISVVTSGHLQNLRDSGGHVKSPTESEG